MKRPAFLIGFSYLSSLLVAIYLGVFYAQILAAAFIVLFIISLFFKDVRKKKAIPISFLTISIALGVYAFSYINNVVPNEQFAQKDAIVSGSICDVPYKAYNKYYYVIDVNKLTVDNQEQSVNFKLRCSLSGALDADLYDKLTAKMHLFLPDDNEGFSSRSYYLSRNIQFLGYIYEYEDYSIETVENKPIYYYFLKIREAVIKKFDEIFPGELSSFASGILLGQKSSLSSQIKDNFRDIGIYHLLAVSGLHLSVILNFFMALLLFLKVKKKHALILSCILALTFMAITGFTPSITRAGIMHLIYFTGLIFLKRSDSLNSLGIAICALTFINPFSAGDVGLLLSVYSTLGITLYSSRINAFLENKLSYKGRFKKQVSSVLSLSSVTIAATLLTTPIIILSFKRVSLISVLSNVLIVPISSLMLVFILITAALSFWGIINFICTPVAFISSILMKFVIFATGLLAKIPFAAVSTTENVILIWLASTLILIALALFLYKDLSFIKITSLLSCIVLLVGIFSLQIMRHNVTELALLNTGDGCSVVLTKGKNSAVLACGGDNFKLTTLSNYLDSKNIDNLDILMLSDFDDKTALYAQDIAVDYSPANIVIPNNEYIDDKLSRAIADNENVTFYKNKAEIKLWDNVKILTSVSGNKGFAYVRVNDVNILICPSGISFDKIPEGYTSCDIVIMGDVGKDHEKIDSFYAALAMSLDKVNKKIKDVAKTGKNILSTPDGIILFDFYGNKNICIKRA